LYEIKKELNILYNDIDYIKSPLMINILKVWPQQIKKEYSKLFETNKYIWWINLINEIMIYNDFFLEQWIYYKNEKQFDRLISDNNKINIISINYFDYWNNKWNYNKYIS